MADSDNSAWLNDSDDTSVTEADLDIELLASSSSPSSSSSSSVSSPHTQPSPHTSIPNSSPSASKPFSLSPFRNNPFASASASPASSSLAKPSPRTTQEESKEWRGSLERAIAEDENRIEKLPSVRDGVVDEEQGGAMTDVDLEAAREVKQPNQHHPLSHSSLNRTSSSDPQQNESPEQDGDVGYGYVQNDNNNNSNKHKLSRHRSRRGSASSISGTMGRRFVLKPQGYSHLMDEFDEDEDHERAKEEEDDEEVSFRRRFSFSRRGSFADDEPGWVSWLRYTSRSMASCLPQYLPIIKWLPNYTKHSFLSDAMAGISVGVLLIPSSLAYATLAQLPPVFGLYTAFFPLILYCIFGTSRHISIGPEMTSSILIGQAIISMPDVVDENGELLESVMVGHALSLTLLVGVITTLLGLFRLGFIDSVLSTPVMSGFVSAVALILMSDQLGSLLGLPPCPHALCGDGAGVVPKLRHVFGSLGQTSWRSALIAAFCLVYLFGVERLKQSDLARRGGRLWTLFPHLLVLVLVTTFISWAADLKNKGVAVLGLAGTGFLPPSFPSFDLPNLSQLLPTATTISVLGFVESQLIAKRSAAKFGYHVSPDRELVALGLTSMVGSCFGAFSAFGSLTRTKVQETAGGVSQISGAVAACVVLFVILFLMPFFAYMPLAATAAIIFSVALGIIEVDEVKFLWRIGSYRELGLCLLMAVVTALLGVDVGIFFAFAVCLLMVVKQTSFPSITLLGRGRGDNEFHDLSDVRMNAQTIEGMLIFKIEGPLYFANSSKLKECTGGLDYFRTTIIANAPPKRRSSVSSIGSTSSDMSSLASAPSSPRLEAKVTINGSNSQQVNNNNHSVNDNNNNSNNNNSSSISTDNSPSSPEEEVEKPLHVTSVIFDLSSVTSVDATAAHTFLDIVTQYGQAGVLVCLVRLRPKIQRILDRAGVLDELAKTNRQFLFWRVRDAVICLQSAQSLRMVQPCQLAVDVVSPKSISSPANVNEPHQHQHQHPEIQLT